VMRDALAGNLDIALAAARLQQSRALARESGATELPQVGLSAGASRARTPDGSGGARSSNQLGASLGASWELDLFGRRADERRAAAADVLGSEALWQAARVAIAGEVARLYFEHRGAQERLRVAQEALALQREVLKLVDGRLQAGRGTALDSERARALVLGTEASVPALELQALLLRQRMAVLCGLPPQALEPRLAAARPLPGLKAVPLGAIGSPETLLQRRPDLQAARAQAEAAAARVGQTMKARWPALTLSGSLGLNAGRLADLGQSASFVYSLGAALAWSLFDGGAADARTDAAGAVHVQALRAYERAVLLALEDTEAALATYTRTQQQGDSLFQAALAADKAAAVARGRFDVGVSDFFAVLDSERERLNARDRLAQVQTASAVALVGVYRALAGGLGAPPAAR
jgi:outer membrane protein, multidrug efflux system